MRCFGQALTNWGAPAAGLTKWSGLADVFLLRASGAAPLQGGWWGGALELASSSALGGLGRPRTPQRGNRWPTVPPAGIDWAPGPLGAGDASEKIGAVESVLAAAPNSIKTTCTHSGRDRGRIDW